MEPIRDGNGPGTKTLSFTSNFEFGSCSKSTPNTRFIDTESDDDSISAGEESLIEEVEYTLAGETDLFRQTPPAGHNYVSPDMKRLKKKDTRELDYIGALNLECEHYGAMYWFAERSKKQRNCSNPKLNHCCKEGKVKLPMLKKTPAFLEQLLNYEGGVDAKNFRQNIRAYNSMHSFTSFGASIDQSIARRPGPFCFRIQGQTYHCMGSLVPLNGEAPKFAQLYIVDTAHEVDNRLAALNSSVEGCEIRRNIVEGLGVMLDEVNKLVKFFRLARDAYEENVESEFQLQLVLRNAENGPNYNAPENPEVVALIVDDDHELAKGFDIVVQYKSGLLQRISTLHPSYMSLQYPLLFPYGEDGYHPQLLLTGAGSKTNGQTVKKKRDRMSATQYYCFRLQQRRQEPKRLLMGGRLLHQFVVDAYTSVEHSRLTYHPTHQHILRSELYQGLRDAFARGDTLKRVGRRIILPSSFTGGPRYMQQNYQDAMAICRAFSHPDLFLTFTCNAKWREFDEALKHIPGQKIEDRPDLIARVFKMKQDALMRYLKNGKYFGAVDAALYTVEFQKRGLPHAHIIIWLKEKDKPLTPEQIDRLISAEIPDVTIDPKGYEACMKYMMHGPCGNLNPKCPRMRNGTCTKNFLKQFVDSTTINSEGFAIYRRRNTSVTVQRNKSVLDNRHVVPHNIDLVIKFDAHINVEWCNKSNAVKYLFKYINKGADRARAQLQRKNKQDEVDEIESFLDCRYLSAIEACWRIFEFDIHCRDPVVQRLQFHLKDQQNVVFSEKDNITKVVNIASKRDSMLTAWFKVNATCPEARNLTYLEFPTKWVWDKPKAAWKKRKQGRSIGRLYYAHPASGDRFFQRILLNLVKSCTSYRTYNNVVYSTYREACEARGLIGNDDEWREAMAEAYKSASGTQMRELFMTIILFCDVANPRSLWNDTWHLMQDDIVHSVRQQLQDPNLNLPQDELQDRILIELDALFHENGYTLQNYHLPKPKQKAVAGLKNRFLADELMYDTNHLQKEHERLFATLNEDQLSAYNQIMESVQEQKGKLFFVYGQGGTGKTHLWKTLLARIRSEGKPAIAVALSGITALLLPGGRTAHSRFNIPVDCQDNSTCTIALDSQLGELIREAELIISDEAPMDHKFCFEALNATLKDVMLPSNPNANHMVFGGKTVVLGGDFRQVLPVIENGGRIDSVRACINRSNLWNDCQILLLRKNMQLLDNGLLEEEKIELNMFAQWLVDVGDGKVPAKSFENDDSDWIKIPQQLLLPPEKGEVAHLFDEIFPDFEKNRFNRDYLKERAILTPTNRIVDEINYALLDKIKSPKFDFYSYDSVCSSSGDMSHQAELYPTDYLNSLDFNGIPPHKLTLKLGAPVILLRNLNQRAGLCNGTRLIITKLGERVMEAEILIGERAGQTCIIPRITLTPSTSKLPIKFKRRQYPLKLSFALTINKSQGQTLKKVGLYIPEPVFSHGQLYVALSRVQSKDGLVILIKAKNNDSEGYTKNVVYKEVFERLKM